MKRLLTIAALAALCTAPAFAEPAPSTQPASKPGAAQPTTAAPKPAMHAEPAGAKPAGAMDSKGMDPKAMEAAMEAASKPGAFHKWLESFEGTWDAVVKETDPAGGKATEEKGEMTNKMVFGGRFLEMSYKGRMHGKFFYGFGTMGYNNTDKRFESTWYDSMTSAICTLTGQVDSSQRVLTTTNEGGVPTTCPMTGEKTKMRCVLTLNGKDSYAQEFYTTINGMEMKVMDITYTRSKGGKADTKADTKTDMKTDTKATDTKPMDKKPTK